MIERVLPWSRMLGRRGAETDKRFISECMQRQESLVFKPTGLFGGEGVLIGREVDPGTWREALTASTQTGCLVQEIVLPNVECDEIILDLEPSPTTTKTEKQQPDTTKTTVAQHKLDEDDEDNDDALSNDSAEDGADNDDGRTLDTGDSLDEDFDFEDDDDESLLFSIPSAFPSFTIIFLTVSFNIIFDPANDVIQ